MLRSPIWWGVIAVGLAAFCLVYRHSVSRRPQPPVVFTGPALGTQYTVKVVDAPRSLDLDAIEEQTELEFDEVELLEAVTTTPHGLSLVADSADPGEVPPPKKGTSPEPKQSTEI